MEGADLYGAVTTPEPYVVPADGPARFRVAALDVGIKSNTPRMLAARGIQTHEVIRLAESAAVVPTTPEDILSLPGLAALLDAAIQAGDEPSMNPG